jgi:hypothetical protein
VVFPFYRAYNVLRQSSAAYKALKVLKSGVLKRLASTRLDPLTTRRAQNLCYLLADLTSRFIH